MSDYTVKLKEIIDIYGRNEVESWFKSYNLEDSLTPEQIQILTKDNVWSKDKLAKMIVDHYFMREIGFETPALFSHYAKVTMNEIMPRYLLKIYTQFLEYDPLSSVDYTEEYTREIQGNASGSSNSNSTNKSNSLGINNSTPQKRITAQDLATGAYASNVNQSNSEGEINDETETQSNSSTVERYTHTMKGDNGVIVTNQYLVREFRELAISFNEEIINELNILFMGLF